MPALETTKTQNFMLFTLGKWYEESNKSMKEPLEVCISKKNFIELVMNAGISEKHERALYKNLESLEKNKLVSYENKKLVLTKKGKSLFEKLDNSIMPYIKLYEKLKISCPTSYLKRVQTFLCSK